MNWYLKALLRDRRFRFAAGVAAGSVTVTTAGLLYGATWALHTVTFGVFPIFGLSLAAMFLVLGLIVRDDYMQRKG